MVKTLPSNEGLCPGWGTKIPDAHEVKKERKKEIHFSDSKESTCSAGDLGSIPGSGRSPGEGNGNPLQYSCLENPMDGGAWRATVCGVSKSRT